MARPDKWSNETYKKLKKHLNTLPGKPGIDNVLNYLKHKGTDRKKDFKNTWFPKNGRSYTGRKAINFVRLLYLGFQVPPEIFNIPKKEIFGDWSSPQVFKYNAVNDVIDQQYFEVTQKLIKRLNTKFIYICGLNSSDMMCSYSLRSSPENKKIHEYYEKNQSNLFAIVEKKCVEDSIDCKICIMTPYTILRSYEGLTGDNKPKSAFHKYLKKKYHYDFRLDLLSSWVINSSFSVFQFILNLCRIKDFDFENNVQLIPISNSSKRTQRVQSNYIAIDDSTLLIEDLPFEKIGASNELRIPNLKDLSITNHSPISERSKDFIEGILQDQDPLTITISMLELVFSLSFDYVQNFKYNSSDEDSILLENINEHYNELEKLLSGKYRHFLKFSVEGINSIEDKIRFEMQKPNWSKEYLNSDGQNLHRNFLNKMSTLYQKGFTSINRKTELINKDQSKTTIHESKELYIDGKRILEIINKQQEK